MPKNPAYTCLGFRVWGNNVLILNLSKRSRPVLFTENIFCPVYFYGGMAFVLVLALGVMRGLIPLWWGNDALTGLSIIPFLTGSLVYLRWESFRRLPQIFFYPAYLASILTGGVSWWSLGNGDVRVGGLLFIFSMGFFLVSFFGKASVALVLGPLFFLCMMVPVTLSFLDTVTLGLQHFFSALIDFLAPWINSDYAGRDGFILRFMGGNSPVAIVAECSGVRSMMGMVIMSGYFSIADKLSLRKTVVLILGAVGVSLLLNLVRVLVTIELNLHDLQDYSKGKLHGALGIFVFMAGAVFLSKCAKKLQG